MKLTQLKQFKEIAESNSISIASKKLHVSQPALSTMLRKLEKEFGVSLFDRSENRIALNQAGKIVLVRAREIISNADKMEEALHEYALRNSHIRIGFCDPEPMWYCVPQLSMFAEYLVYEQYRSYNDEEDLLLSGKYDILISSKRLSHCEIESKKFIDERIYLSIHKHDRLRTFPQCLLRRMVSLFHFSVNSICTI